MKTLSLAYPEQSEIKFKVSKYPDGQQDLTLLDVPGDVVKTLESASMWYTKDPLRIESRFNSLEDLGLILCATKALKRLGVEEIELFIPYLLGARADRLFKEGGTSYLVDVIAPILNEQNYKHVIVIDAHSDVAAACIRNLRVQDNKTLVSWAIADIYGIKKGTETPPYDKFALVSPDGGSLKKIYTIADYLGPKTKVIICGKYRDVDGKLSKVSVAFSEEDKDKDLIIIDDICDGGRTFINLIQKAREEGYTGKAYLIVTHGIFSAGFDNLREHFNGIFCTNSVFEIKSHAEYNKIKQLNIFKHTL